MGFSDTRLRWEVVHAAARIIDSVVDALQAEVWACSAGVKAANDHGMGCVIIETDSLVQQQALRGGLIYELKCILRLSFISYSIVFAPRTCNRVAHEIAALGCKYSHDTTHMDHLRAVNGKLFWH